MNCKKTLIFYISMVLKRFIKKYDYLHLLKSMWDDPLLWTQISWYKSEYPGATFII